MNIEQAIKHGQEQIDIFGGEHKEFIEIAIKSLDMWDKVLNKIYNIYWANHNEYMYSEGLNKAIEIIENYKGEVEE